MSRRKRTLSYAVRISEEPQKKNQKKNRRRQTAHDKKLKWRADQKKKAKEKEKLEREEKKNGEIANGTKTIRVRRRSSALRTDVANKIGKALRSSPSPIGHLFSRLDESGTPMASLRSIASLLSLDDRLFTLATDTIKSISARTDFFVIDEEDGELVVKYRSVQCDPTTRSVYIDRLPDGVTVDLIRRICSKYGMVLDVRLPFHCPVSEGSEFKRKGSPRGFAFVEFASEDAVHDIVEDFKFNAPGGDAKKRRFFFYNGKRFHLKRFSSREQGLEILKVLRRRKLRIRLEKAFKHKLRIRVMKIRKHRLRKKMAEFRKEMRQKQKERRAKKKAEEHMQMEQANGKKKKHKKEKPIRKGKHKNHLWRTLWRMKWKKYIMRWRRRRKHKVKKRKRFRRRRVIKCSLSKYFADIQVITLLEYRRLREEYLRLRDDARVAASRALRSLPVKTESWYEHRQLHWNIHQE